MAKFIFHEVCYVWCTISNKIYELYGEEWLYITFSQN